MSALKCKAALFFALALVIVEYQAEATTHSTTLHATKSTGRATPHITRTSQRTTARKHPTTELTKSSKKTTETMQTTKVSRTTSRQTTKTTRRTPKPDSYFSTYYMDNVDTCGTTVDNIKYLNLWNVADVKAWHADPHKPLGGICKLTFSGYGDYGLKFMFSHNISSNYIRDQDVSLAIYQGTDDTGTVLSYYDDSSSFPTDYVPTYSNYITIVLTNDKLNITSRNYDFSLSLTSDLEWPTTTWPPVTTDTTFPWFTTTFNPVDSTCYLDSNSTCTASNDSSNIKYLNSPSEYVYIDAWHPYPDKALGGVCHVTVRGYANYDLRLEFIGGIYVNHISDPDVTLTIYEGKNDYGLLLGSYDRYTSFPTNHLRTSNNYITVVLTNNGETIGNDFDFSLYVTSEDDSYYYYWSMGTICGTALAIVGFIVLISVLAVVLCRRRQRRLRAGYVRQVDPTGTGSYSYPILTGQYLTAYGSTTSFPHAATPGFSTIAAGPPGYSAVPGNEEDRPEKCDGHPLPPTNEC